MKNVCEVCRVTFTAPPSQKARFCSRKCYDRSREGLFVCNNCSKCFSYYKSHKKGKFVYCSRKCQIEHMQGERHPNWRGGRHLYGGYYWIFVDRGKRIKEQRFVMEEHLGRKLLSTEIVHHINGIKTDNRIENLVITNRSSHASVHKENSAFQVGHKPFPRPKYGGK